MDHASLDDAEGKNASNGEVGAAKRTRFRVIALSLVAFVVVVGLIVAVTDRGGGPSGGVAMKPAQAPNFTLALVGKPSEHFELKSVRGKAVVLNFWQSSCIPCQVEMPMLERLSLEAKDKVTVVGVDITDDPGLARAFLEKHPVTYTLVADPNATLSGPYRVDATPQTFVISPSGMIVAHFIGPLPQGALTSAITKDLGIHLS